MSERRLATLKGYPIPRARRKHIHWVNGTPHLSKAAAHVHEEAIGRYSYAEFVDLLYGFLSPLLSDDQRVWLDRAHQAALAGEKSTEKYFRALLTRSDSDRGIEYMLDRLLEDKVESAREPLFAEDSKKIESQVMRWVESLPKSRLTDYELKLAKKYLGEASSRTGQGYIEQIKKYLPSRREFVDVPMPDIVAYEEALRIHYDTFGLPSIITKDGVCPYDSIVGFLSRARKTTFGGYPYLSNMADFVSDDPENPTTFSDWYNELAIAYLFLSPAAKEYFAFDFVALERVQPGGVEDYIDEDGAVAYIGKKPNKQRFVQAQSAVMSHAMKFFVDAMTEQMRRTAPNFVADKFNEENVTVFMKTAVKQAFPGQRLRPDASALINIVGTDFTNYDAHQDVSVSNDSAYQCWRLLFPEFMTEYLIDPYVKSVYRKGRILVPKFGYIQTTGVRSGMVDTNQTDTLNCSVCDQYELIRYRQEHPDDALMADGTWYAMCTKTHAANGDDRFKLSPCSAKDLEKYDWELGYIAQASKQEILYSGDILENLSVTYLKTIVCVDPTNFEKLVRTDSIAKLILSKLNPERVKPFPMPYSMLVDMLMSASRSYESPYLYAYVDFMYKYVSTFRALVDGNLSWDQIVAGMVTEQMEVLRLRKGKVWMQRKGIDYDYVVEQMNIKFGYGDEGFRGNEEALRNDRADAGIAQLPAVVAIQRIAYERKANGTLGSTFA